MTINCKGNLIDLSTPKVMGILNITPDSFYDGGKYKNEHDILLQVEKMLQGGATFVDVGAYSSRPGAENIPEDEELKKSVEVTRLILKHFPDCIISVDTFRSKVAKENIEAGAALVNDISAGDMDNKMMETVAKFQVPYIIMHMKGIPETMQKNINYKDVVKEIIYYFSKKIADANKLKINDLIIDPGFGFGKTLDNNYEILNKLELFKMPELPILVGASRKSMIYKLLNINPNDALNGTTSINTIALLKGANILRVHDVKEAMECVKIFNQLNSYHNN
ncbi:dihydropteroate synthase [Abyssalbus ytuae]|uniref:Dihydropteroate synthase n=1 Tax=Abyssalbus ytuae TaxID=2926907 RepID=A0A9E6ZJ78_9FLAO|nr:dihydropteroate synthase [Abyssalbus ytuae]UOB16559.1 dihydropteroate synthase [Abyssalbus ytuae]